MARSGAFLPAAHSSCRRHRFAGTVLAGARLGLRNIVPFWCRRPALYRIHLSRRADHDRVVHFDLHYDVGHRRSQGRLPAFGHGGARVALGNCARQGARWSDIIHSSGIDISGLRSAGWYSHWIRKLRTGRDYCVPCLVCAHRAGICDCLAHGLEPSVSRNHQFIFDSIVVTLWSAISSLGRFDLRLVAAFDRRCLGDNRQGPVHDLRADRGGEDIGSSSQS